MAVHVKKNIISKEVRVSDLNSEGDMEVCAVRCDEMGVIIACVYRPPSGNHKIFFSNMEKLLRRICNGDSTVIICGDFNINLLEKHNRQEIRYGNRLIKLLDYYDLTASIETPIRITKSTSTLIDNIFTNQAKNTFTACNRDPGLSDHFSQVLHS